MTAKLACRGLTGPLGPSRTPVMAVPCNDNRPRRHSNPKPMQRHSLACHWRVRPQTGALECMWQAER
jgi:hypothetical protein